MAGKMLTYIRSTNPQRLFTKLISAARQDSDYKFFALIIFPALRSSSVNFEAIGTRQVCQLPLMRVSRLKSFHLPDFFYFGGQLES